LQVFVGQAHTDKDVGVECWREQWVFRGAGRPVRFGVGARARVPAGAGVWVGVRVEAWVCGGARGGPHVKPLLPATHPEIRSGRPPSRKRQRERKRDARTRSKPPPAPAPALAPASLSPRRGPPRRLRVRGSSNEPDTPPFTREHATKQQPTGIFYAARRQLNPDHAAILGHWLTGARSRFRHQATKGARLRAPNEAPSNAPDAEMQYLPTNVWHGSP
jgi:hypothetical protein